MVLAFVWGQPNTQIAPHYPERHAISLSFQKSYPELNPQAVEFLTAFQHSHEHCTGAAPLWPRAGIGNGESKHGSTVPFFLVPGPCSRLLVQSYEVFLFLQQF